MFTISKVLSKLLTKKSKLGFVDEKLKKEKIYMFSFPTMLLRSYKLKPFTPTNPTHNCCNY